MASDPTAAGAVMAGTPARGYSWPPFAEGNTAALRHGIWSNRKVEPVMAELVAGVLDDRPDLADFPEAVMAWARAESRCLLLHDWITDHGLIDGEGDPRAPLKHVAQFERLAVELRGRLGLDPRSESELIRSQADAVHARFDLAKLRERGREALERRGRALPAGGPP